MNSSTTISDSLSQLRTLSNQDPNFQSYVSVVMAGRIIMSLSRLDRQLFSDEEIKEFNLIADRASLSARMFASNINNDTY
jgi:hypothetical protein